MSHLPHDQACGSSQQSNEKIGYVTLLLCDLDDSLVDRAGAFCVWANTMFGEANGQGREFTEWLIAMENNDRRPRSVLFNKVRERLSLTETVENSKGATTRT